MEDSKNPFENDSKLESLDESLDLGINKMANGNYSPSVNVAFGSMKSFMKNKDNFRRDGHRKSEEKKT